MVTNLDNKRVFKDVNYIHPPLVFDDDLWGYEFDLYDKDFGIKKKYEETISLYEKEFNSFSDYANERMFLTSILSDYFKKQWDMRRKIDLKALFDGKQENFKGLEDNHSYLTIDEECAAMQTSEIIGLTGDKSWKDFFRMYTSSELLINSKRMRVDIAKNCNEAIAAPYNTMVMMKILDDNVPIMKLLNENNIKLTNVLNDEFMWDITGKEELFKPFVTEKATINGIKIHIGVFTFNRIWYKDIDNNIKSFGVRTDYVTGRKKYHIYKNPLFPQFVKLAHDLPIEEKDLYYPTGLEFDKFEKPIERTESPESE